MTPSPSPENFNSRLQRTSGEGLDLSKEYEASTASLLGLLIPGVRDLEYHYHLQTMGGKRTSRYSLHHDPFLKKRPSQSAQGTRSSVPSVHHQHTPTAITRAPIRPLRTAGDGQAQHLGLVLPSTKSGQQRSRNKQPHRVYTYYGSILQNDVRPRTRTRTRKSVSAVAAPEAANTIQ